MKVKILNEPKIKQFKHLNVGDTFITNKTEDIYLKIARVELKDSLDNTQSINMLHLFDSEQRAVMYPLSIEEDTEVQKIETVLQVM